MVQYKSAACSVIDGTHKLHHLLPRLRDHCERRGRKNIRGRDSEYKEAVSSGHRRVKHELGPFVTACTRPVQNQATSNPSREKDLGTKPHL